MKEVAIIGVDLAKTVFQLHGAAADGSVVFRKKLTWVQFHKPMSGHPACLVAMEACGSSHYWAGEMAQMGQRDIRRLRIVGAMAVVVHRFEGALPRDHGWRKCWPARPACWSQSRLERQPNTSELIWT